MECMPSTRASGDCRCTTRGDDCPEVGYPDGMSAPPVRKISETILDFGEPLLSQLDAALPLDMIQSTFQIVITVWNAHVIAMPRWGQPRFLADLHERMRDRRCRQRWSRPSARCRNAGSNGLRTTDAPWVMSEGPQRPLWTTGPTGPTVTWRTWFSRASP